ncbi:MAG: VCBS repeat-containing protein [Nitrospirae bacterium]|nr:VCBS repeat-containing protein [Nitrospirota bacterium]
MRTLYKCTIMILLSGIIYCGISYAEVSPAPVTGVIVTKEAPVAVVTTEEMKKNEAMLPQKPVQQKVVPLKRRTRGGVSNTAPYRSQLPSEDTSQSTNLSMANAPSLLTNFTGMDLNGNTSQAIPPDTMGAAGPVYVMSIVNGGVAYYNKSTGAMKNHITDTAFWSALGTGVVDSVFDPKVIYDQYLGRFITVELSMPSSSSYTPSYILVGISSTSDPNGTWTLHAIRADYNGGTTPTNNWADYPGVGMDEANLYVSVNMFDASGSFQYTKAYSIPKTQLMSSASTITYTEFVNNNDTDFTLQPCVAFGSGQQAYFVGEGYSSAGQSYLKLFTISNNAWTDLGYINVQSYPYTWSLPEASQLGSVRKIATNDTRILNAVCRGGYLWATNTVSDSANSKTEVAWYQINPASASSSMASAGSPTQQGRISDTSMFYYFPSIAVNANGDAALGFSGSSGSTYAGAYYTARLSTDTAGTMQAVGQLKAGEAPYYLTYSGTENRWGDYSATCVDPSDDLTFWTIQEYAKGSTNWGTWWGSFATSSSSQYTLAVTMSGSGSGTITPSTGTISWSGLTGTAKYAAGTQVILTAAAASGSSLTSWSGCDSTSGNTCTVTMASNKSVSAVFTDPTKSILTVVKQGTGLGSVTPSTGTITWSGKTGTASYTTGTQVTLSAAASAGSTFSSWSGCDSTSGSSCVVTMSSDKSVTAAFTAIVKGDFMGNGNADILWRNSLTGANALWTMSATTPTGVVSFPSVTDPAWEITGTADFTSNGYPGILWRNGISGSNILWVTSAGSVTSSMNFPTVSDTSWKIAGTGDFDADGYPDVLWRNSMTGNVAIWLMTGTSVKSAVSLPSITDTTWEIAGTGDFNADGSVDIVWRNYLTGYNAIWLLNGTSVTSAQYLQTVSDTQWKIAAISDYNADGYPDIVWRNSVTGENAIWLMNGLTATSTVSLPTISDTSWKIAGPR